ncbi:MAG TPA: hypothetical protein VFQ61_02430, partial [Polyangiaceae bacterium]|nr:hypothetical protein [Polyangiaceae bacterium]
AKGKGEDAGGQGKGKGQGQPGGTRELEFVEVPSISQHMGAGSPSGSSGEKAGKDASPGQENGSGREPGKGHDDNLQGDPTAPLAGQTQDVTAAGVDTGQGTASAEVIQGAAERGFVGKAYRDVYVQYETVAEQSLEHDNIPPGYRFYVRRYFQLIRPRE